jgi:hypothetical protein
MSASPLLGVGFGAENGRDVVAQPEFLSVIGVQNELERLGTRFVDDDTIEINADIPQSITTSANNLEVDLITPSPESWSYLDFFSMHRPESDARSLPTRISLSLLTSNLANVAICLGRGPVYPRHEVRRVVKTSAAIF